MIGRCGGGGTAGGRRLFGSGGPAQQQSQRTADSAEDSRRVRRLYREQFSDFNARHFHEKPCEPHGIDISYPWVYHGRNQSHGKPREESPCSSCRAHSVIFGLPTTRTRPKRQCWRSTHFRAIPGSGSRRYALLSIATRRAALLLTAPGLAVEARPKPLKSSLQPTISIDVGKGQRLAS